MTTVSKQFFLADRNPSNWALVHTTTIDEEDNEVDGVSATNIVTGSTFRGTVTAFNAYLAMVPGDDYNIEELYDLEPGVLTPPVLNTN